MSDELPRGWGWHEQTHSFPGWLLYYLDPTPSASSRSHQLVRLATLSPGVGKYAGLWYVQDTNGFNTNLPAMPLAEAKAAAVHHALAVDVEETLKSVKL